MNSSQLHLLLADDDAEDREMFQEALGMINSSLKLTEIEDGKKLMDWLAQARNNLPDLLFLDINMPLKNGHDCLAEIKNDPQLQSLPVFIYSTSINPTYVDSLYNNGAHFYIKKPASFQHIVEVIERMLRFSEDQRRTQPPRQDFIISYGYWTDPLFDKGCSWF